MESKKPWFSRSIIFNLLFALSAFYPPVGNWMKDHVEILASIWGGLNVVLRMLTKGKIVLSD